MAGDEVAGEAASVAAAEAPRTRASLLADLRALGVQPGMTLMVHASMSRLGWVAGGSVAVVQALLDAVGEQGTLAMPAFTGDLTDPAYWQRPPVPPSWHEVIREQTPAFDPAVTPTRMMGRVAETFRTWPGTLRSDHPHASVCARGPLARQITDGHQLEDSMGEGSPFARLYDAGASALQLGTDRNSSLHLAEHRCGLRGRVTQGAPVQEGGVRIWKVFSDLAYDDDSFPPLKAAFAASGTVRVGPWGRHRRG
ncbi:aminoglycoside N(3)-acetyltransferase [Deinococcus altitudinis]|uniref:aminoglycoside N(3)-acetyltransferase n=1 Tax=Deinococcus altitudinis TaxID=468914 RepID=UPI00389273A7